MTETRNPKRNPNIWWMCWRSPLTDYRADYNFRMIRRIPKSTTISHRINYRAFHVRKSIATYANRKWPSGKINIFLVEKSHHGARLAPSSIAMTKFRRTRKNWKWFQSLIKSTHDSDVDNRHLLFVSHQNTSIELLCLLLDELTW